jgi:hypothetical protein
MVAGTPFQRIRAFERIRPENLHLPPVTSLRADDQYLPLPWPIRKDVFDTRDESDFREAGRKLNEKQKSNALLEIPFRQSSGMISTKTGHSDRSEAAPLHAQLPT